MILKKLCSILLALFLVICTSPIVFAEEVVEDNTTAPSEIEMMVEEEPSDAAAAPQEQPQVTEQEEEKEVESQVKEEEKVETPTEEETKTVVKSAPAALAKSAPEIPTKNDTEEDEEETYTVSYTYRVWNQWAECEQGTLLSEEKYTKQYKVGDEVWMPSIVSNGSYLFALPGHPQEILWGYASVLLEGGGNPEDLGAEFLYPDGYLIPSMIAENVDLIYNYGPLYDTVRCEDYMQDDNGDYQLVNSTDYSCSIGYDISRKSKEIEGYTFNDKLSNLVVHLSLRSLGDDLFKLTRYWDKNVEPEPDPVIPDPEPQPESTPDPVNPTPTPDPVIPTPKPVTPVTPTEGGGGDGENYEVITIAAAPTPATEAPLTAEVEEINDIRIPLAKTEETWALVNLIAMVVTVTISLILTILGWYNRWRRRNIELDEDENEKYQFWLRNKILFRIINSVLAIVSIITFILTENIFLKLVFVDRFTPLMIAFAMLAIGAALFSKYVIKEYYPQTQEEEDDEESDEDEE